MPKILYIWQGGFPWDVRAEKICLELISRGCEATLLARWVPGQPPRGRASWDPGRPGRSRTSPRAVAARSDESRLAAGHSKDRCRLAPGSGDRARDHARRSRRGRLPPRGRAGDHRHGRALSGDDADVDKYQEKD